MSPMASAPASLTACASLIEVTPQILTKERTSVRLSTTALGDGGEGAHRNRWLGRAHEALAHQDGVKTGLGGALDVFARRETGLRDRDDVARQRPNNRSGPIGTDLKGAQIALIDANDARTEVNGSARFVVIVDFYQGGKSTLLSHRKEKCEFPVAQCGHDQEHGARAHRRCVEHVIGAHREVLAQQGQRAGRPHRGNILRRTGKVGAISEYGNGAGPAFLVVEGQSSGVQMLVDPALGGRSTLYFRDRKSV